MPSINVKNKGANGEREIAATLNDIVKGVLKELGYDVPGHDIIQRNQNQSAVGGNDLSNTFGLSIEVKRQEALSVNTWWAQCVAAAGRNAETPVLIYRQNRKAWHVVMNAEVPLPAATSGTLSRACKLCRVTITYDDFQSWFREYVKRKLLAGYELRV